MDSASDGSIVMHNVTSSNTSGNFILETGRLELHTVPSFSLITGKSVYLMALEISSIDHNGASVSLVTNVSITETDL